MTDYAIGDIQGCFQPLQNLLAKVDFSPSRDRLWVAGDLINRGPESLETLRYLRTIDNAAEVVLGNHDLHLMAVAMGGHKTRNKDTLEAIFKAPDYPELLNWLRHQHLCLYDEQRDLMMAHAGLPHIWSVDDALNCACEVEAVIRGPEASGYFREMYGNEPACWDPSLTGQDRWRVITNYFTRMRFIASDGTLELETKESAGAAPEGYAPWFSYARKDSTKVIFGHWAALEGKTEDDQFHGLDTGCVWGGSLTLMNIDTQERISCDC